jgi:hypothetical protein
MTSKTTTQFSERELVQMMQDLAYKHFGQNAYCPDLYKAVYNLGLHAASAFIRAAEQGRRSPNQETIQAIESSFVQRVAGLQEQSVSSEEARVIAAAMLSDIASRAATKMKSNRPDEYSAPEERGRGPGRC